MTGSLSRRKLLGASLSLPFLTTPPLTSARASATLASGAIRWDAWDATGTTIEQGVDKSLSPPDFRGRAPWYAKLTSPTTIEIDGDHQSLLDDEIKFAMAAGLNYWAYVWYGPADPMQEAWRLHQASAYANDVNWCMILGASGLGTEESFSRLIPTYIRYFGQKNYQKVEGQRPLLYISMDNLTAFFKKWGSYGILFRTVITELRQSCLSAGLGRPYIVIMEGEPVMASRVMAEIDADAISNYMGRVPPHSHPTPFSVLDQSVRTYWNEMAATGAPVIPVCTTGWDTRPLKLNPPAFARGYVAGVGMNEYIQPGSPHEIASHVQAAVNFVHNNPRVCPAKAIIIYSWNECAEGGSALVPSYTVAGRPNVSILDAVGDVLKAN